MPRFASTWPECKRCGDPRLGGCVSFSLQVPVRIRNLIRRKKTPDTSRQSRATHRSAPDKLPLQRPRAGGSGDRRACQQRLEHTHVGACLKQNGMPSILKYKLSLSALDQGVVSTRSLKVDIGKYALRDTA